MISEEYIGGQLELNIPEGDCVVQNKDNVCLTKNEAELLQPIVGLKGNAKEIIETAQHKLGVNKEIDIWRHPKVKSQLGGKAEKILRENYKAEGPADSIALLNNSNLDDSLAQWAKHSKQLFNKKFYHIPFQMIDFAQTRDKLASLDPADLVTRGYDSFGVILNTDVSTGRGIHWFCLYGDLDHKGTRDDPYVLEYFNSSGNPPMDQVSIWLETTCHNMLRDHQKHCIVHRSVPRRLQHSKTECGMWSILYIRSRLENHPPDWFYQSNTDDEDMISYRRRIFRRG